MAMNDDQFVKMPTTESWYRKYFIFAILFALVSVYLYVCVCMAWSAFFYYISRVVPQFQSKEPFGEQVR